MLTNSLIALAERGLIPDPVTRTGIKFLLRQRLRQEHAQKATRRQAKQRQLLVDMARSPIAVHTESANEQHYELPAEFFALWLGSRMKYSAGYWNGADQSLAQAEEAMLRLSAQRAGIEDGMEVLDLGCGWGSMTLWLAEQFPACHILGVSNSSLQRAYIERMAADKNLHNVTIRTCDINHLELDRTFDRIVSVEMFEHMRNYEELLFRISNWLKPEGRLFVHIFCHKSCAYFFDTDGDNDWMARHFFTGGLMPSEDLLPRFQAHLSLSRQWRVNGCHYSRTALAWLANLDHHRQAALAILQTTYGTQRAEQWFERWRLFLLSCAELFDYRNGEEWFVSHYVFQRNVFQRHRRSLFQPSEPAAATTIRRLSS
ncbi:MAG: SAM-dependent methyltransferase [Gammaproteobacteria bacterium]